MAEKKRGFRFSVDRGGTFTDIYAELPDGSHRTLKLLSVHPSHYTDAPREGIRRIIAEYKGEVDHPSLGDEELSKNCN